MSLLAPSLGAPSLGLLAGAIPFPFADLLFADAVPLDVCVHLRPWSVTAGGLVDIYWSALGFTSAPDDAPANRHFKSRVLGLGMSRGLASGGALGGRGELRSATLEIGTLDAIEVSGTSYDPQAFLREFSIIGRAVEVRLVRDSYADGKPLFVGVADEWGSAQRGRLEVRLRGKSLALGVPFQPARYGGTGGVDGTADLKDKPKPVLYGRARGIRPALEDPTEQLYRVHTDTDGDGARIDAIERVLLQGTPLLLADSGTGGDYATTAALLAATQGAFGSGADIEAGEYATCLAEGCFRLGTDQNDGVLTCDARGAVVGGDYLDRTGEIARDMLKSYGAELTDADLAAASFTSLDGDFDYPTHLWLSPDDDVAHADALDLLMASVLGAWSDGADGMLSVFQVRRATGSPLLAIDDGDIVADRWEWVELPREVRPAVRSATVGWGRNYTVTNDLAGGAAAADVAFFAAEYRTIERTQAFIQFAETAVLRLDTQLTTEAGAQALGDLALALYDGEPRRARVPLKHLGLAFFVASKARITHAREGVSAQLARVIGVDLDTRTFDVTLDVLLEPAA